MKHRHIYLGICAAIVISGCADNGEITPHFCPSDALKPLPGVCGCDVADTDTDEDGTPDCLDKCPDDPNKQYEGICGCGKEDIDSDEDGTPDCLDKCPNDPNKQYPGFCGCGQEDTDKDNDTVPDCLVNGSTEADFCPDTDKKAPGVCGCDTEDVDSDGDGFMDCVDLCPTDPNKQTPGICDCENEDVDSDGDGVYDCHDQCPQNPNKVFKGLCGCLQEDTLENISDSDGDGVINCLDACPNNPDKTAAGSDGNACDITDSDNDGVEDKDDACPFNPNIQSGKNVDCNYVTDEKGNEVFEIWTAQDLIRLQTEFAAKTPYDTVGYLCDPDKATSKCATKNGAGYVMECRPFFNLYSFWNINNSCGEDYVCTESDGSAACTQKLCNDTQTPQKAGDCCDVKTFANTCAKNGNILSCQNGTVIETPCAPGCIVPEATEDAPTPSPVCPRCSGTENLTTGGTPYDCCDMSTYVNTCTSKGTLLYCNGYSVAEETCAIQCDPDGKEKGVAACTTCKGTEVVTKDGAVDSCCDPKTYQSSCQDDTLLTCEEGRVVSIPCMFACVDNIADTPAYCKIPRAVFEEELSTQHTQVRLMQDIDLTDAIKVQESAGECVGDWNSLDVNNIDIDGNHHKITFTSNDKRCAITRPIFNNIVNSTIKDLDIDLDIKGAASAVLSNQLAYSMIDGVTWSGAMNVGFSILGENATSTSVFTQYALFSHINNVKYSGTIVSSILPFNGILDIGIETDIVGAEITPDFIFNSGKASTYIANKVYAIGAFGYTRIDDLKVDIPLIKTSVPMAGINFAADSANIFQKSKIAVHGVETPNDTPVTFTCIGDELSSMHEVNAVCENITAYKINAINILTGNNSDLEIQMSNLNGHEIDSIISADSTSNTLTNASFVITKAHATSWVDALETLGMTFEHVAVDLSEITGNSAYGIFNLNGPGSDLSISIKKADVSIFSTNGDDYDGFVSAFDNTTSKVDKVKLDIDEINTVNFSLFSSSAASYKFPSNLQANIGSVTASETLIPIISALSNNNGIENLNYIAQKLVCVDCDITPLSLSDSSITSSHLQFDYLQGKTVNLISHTSKTATLQDLSVYANIYAFKGSNTSGLLKEAAASASSTAKITNIAVSANMNAYTALNADGTPKDAAPTKAFNILIAPPAKEPLGTFTGNNVYWLDRGDGSVSGLTNPADSPEVIKAFTKDNGEETANALAANTKTAVWKTKSITDTDASGKSTFAIPVVTQETPK